jgi:hypothetical protein
MSPADRDAARGDGQVHYHYSREERLAGRAEPKEESGSIFRRNRSLVIILLDVSLVLLMFLLYLFIFRPQLDLVEIGPFQVTGTAFSFDDGIYITVTTTLTDGDREPRTGGASLVTVQWPDGSTVTDALPVDPEYPTVTRAVMPTEPDGTDTEESEQRVGVIIDDVREEVILRVR